MAIDITIQSETVVEVVTFNSELIEVDVPSELIEINIAEQGPQGIPGTAANEIPYYCIEAIPSHTPVVLINNILHKLNNANVSHLFAFVGFTKVSGSPTVMTAVERNIIELQGWGLTTGQHYLAGSNGTMIIQNSTANTFTKVIGYAQSPNSLLIIKDYTSINK